MAWVEAALGKGWDIGDAGYGPPQWQVEDALVSLRGAVVPRSGAGPTAVNVPAHVAPTTTVEWASVGVGANGEPVSAGISLWPSGEARVWYEGPVPTKGIMLTGSYRID